MPQDVPLVGCGNHRFNGFLRIPLTSVDLHTAQLGMEVGREALTSVISRIRQTGRAAHHEMLLKPTLVGRESTNRHTWKHLGNAGRINLPLRYNLSCMCSPDRYLKAFQQAAPPRPKTPRPIVILGSGGIVKAAHLPAYAKAGYPVIALADPVAGKAAALAAETGVDRSFESIREAISFAPPDAVFDIAVPASQLTGILPYLPEGAAVLIQKPMGETIEEARAIRQLCRDRNLAAAVNFQLRYAPNNLGAVALADAGLLGELHDMEVQVRTYTPWQLWTFLSAAPRLEVLYHSIHYLDLVRSWMGNPLGVLARTGRNPQTPTLAATRSSIILDYGDSKRVFIVTTHSHDFADEMQRSFVQWEGTAGAMRMDMGLNLDYPIGRPDTLTYIERATPSVESSSRKWTKLPVNGRWVPDAFIGSMGALQCFVEGSAPTLPSSFEDAFATMALVEAVYRAGAKPGEPVLLN